MKKLLNKRIFFLIFLNMVALVMLSLVIRYQQEQNRQALVPMDTPTLGQITIYSSFTEEQTDEYLAVFEEEYPDIDVDLVNIPPIELVQQLLAENPDIKADVIWGVPSHFILLLEWYDLLKGYAPVGLNNINPDFRDSNTNPQWLGLTGRVISFCTNPTKLAELNLPSPTTWQDLTQPKYKGLLAFPAPESTDTGNLVLIAIVELYQDVLGWDYFDQLHQNVDKYIPDEGSACQLVSEGQYAIGVSFADQIKISDQATLKIEFPISDIVWQMEGIALINKEVIKPAAKTFIDWSISDQAMKLYAKNQTITAVETEIALPEDYTQNVLNTLMHEDFSWIAANNSNIMKEWHKRYDEQ